MAAKKRRPATGGKHPTQRRATTADKSVAEEAKARRAAKAEAAAAVARRRRRRQAKKRAISLGAVGLLVLGAGALVWKSSRAEPNARAAMTATGCRYDSRSDPGTGDTGNTSFSVDPPSGGPHGPSPAASRSYQAEAPDDGAVVHALEHGRIAIWYRPDLPPAEIERLSGLLEVRKGMVLLVPRPSLSGPVAATAWRRRLLCPQPDVDSLARFVRTYANKGPEKQPA